MKEILRKKLRSLKIIEKGEEIIKKKIDEKKWWWLMKIKMMVKIGSRKRIGENGRVKRVRREIGNEDSEGEKVINKKKEGKKKVNMMEIK